MSDPEFSDANYSDEELLEMDTASSLEKIDVLRRPKYHYISLLEKKGRSTRYIQNEDRVLTEFQTFINEEFDGEHLCNITDDHVVASNEFLKSDNRFYTITTNSTPPKRKQIELTDRTRLDYLEVIVRFYNWLVSEDVVSVNPGENAVEILQEDNSNGNEFGESSPKRRRIEMSEIEAFLRWLKQPFHLAIYLFLLKTAARRGETTNVDLCCVNLDHPLYDLILDRHDVELLKEVKDKPDSIFIGPKFNEKSVVRGEKRVLGNKRNREDGSVVPIDSELKIALLQYLLVRRPTTQRHENGCHPFFVQPTQRGRNDRLRDSSIDALVRNTLGEYGWYNSTAATEDKVTFHYFRHYFSHNHRHERRGVYRGYLPEGVRRYVRGDLVGDDSADSVHYDHEHWDTWERYIREPYLEGIYEFGIFD